jgi:putative copper export protein/mono/diheme cytochrome c family protein
MTSAATAMALLRGLHLAATLSLLGTVGFIAWMLPAAAVVTGALHHRLLRLWWVSGLVALLAGAAWFTLQAAAIAGTTTVSDALGALPLVAAHTRYGNILLARVGLLAAATGLACTHAVATRGPRPATPPNQGRWRTLTLNLTLFLIIAALGLQGLVGHAGATAGAIGDGLVLSEALHLVAAGIWLGALLPLGFALRTLSPAGAASVCERFAPIGLACVLVLAGTGFAQGLQLIGSVPALFGTQYGHIALLKIALFLLALVLAGLNRLWLTDRLAAAAGARRHLLLSVSVETCVGLAIVAAAAFMASSPPAVHTTPVWPFSWQFSLVTVNEDPEFRRDVIISLLAIGAAIASMAGSLLWRRLRLPALAVLLLAILLRGPSLTLLTAEAYPTSFQTSPTDFSAVSIARGQGLFAQNCVACHGPNADGNGPAAASLRIKPADLAQPHLWEHTDGELFWWLTHGVDDPEGGLAMPGFAASLAEADRWALIDYVRAHNAGLTTQQDPAFGVPIRAPAIPVTCAGMTASTTADLHGHVVHVVAGEATQIAIPPQAGISTIDLALQDGAKPLPGSCIAANPAAWSAYAVLANLPPDKLAGTEFLVDPDGWLRSVRRPGATGAWPASATLIAAIRGICASPIEQPNGGPHEHHH